MKRYKTTCKLFKIMEVVETIYEGGTTSKTLISSDAKCDSHGRKQKGGESASPINPKTGRTGKRKTKNARHKSY